MRPDRLPVITGLTGAAGAALLLASLLQPVQAQEPDGLGVAQALQDTLVRLIEEAEPSVVSIARYRPTRQGLQPLPDKPDIDFIPNEFGSGVLIAPPHAPRERFVLTNYHVVRDGPVVGQPIELVRSELIVRFHNRETCFARIVGGDPRCDLAVLRLDLAEARIDPAGLKPVKFPENLAARKGQIVVALGNPYAIGRDGSTSASWGIVSNVGRRPAPPVGPENDEDTLKQETVHHLGTLLQLDTRLDLGASGGMVVNLKGEMIGLTSALAALVGYEKSAGFAVAMDAPAIRIVHALSQGLEIEYGFLGVSPRNVTPDELRMFTGAFTQTTAAMAADVIPGSPADQAGLERNDIILAVNGAPVAGRFDLMRDVGLMEPESIARLRIWRERSRRELNLAVKLGKWPVRDDEGIIATTPRYPGWRGVSVDYSTGRYRHLDIPFRRYQPGVVVTSVEENSAGHAAEIRPGDHITHVNEMQVQSPAEFLKSVQGNTGRITLQLSDGRRVVVK